MANRSARQSSGSNQPAEWRASPTASTISGTARIPNPGTPVLAIPVSRPARAARAKRSGSKPVCSTRPPYIPRSTFHPPHSRSTSATWTRRDVARLEPARARAYPGDGGSGDRSLGGAGARDPGVAAADQPEPAAAGPARAGAGQARQAAHAIHAGGAAVVAPGLAAGLVDPGSHQRPDAQGSVRLGFPQ